MKLALITTTINVPTVLALYRACDSEVPFYITGDSKSPDDKIRNFLEDIPGCSYYTIDEQSRLGYACSELIGVNTIARRNIALLEALKWGAEIVVTVDDDNMPISTIYFNRFDWLFQWPFSGIQAVGTVNWFDVGQLLEPPAPHRGFPQELFLPCQAKPVTNVKLGVAAGICLGDPDIGAVERIANAPIVHQVSELLRFGIVVGNGTWTVFNSQNTAFLRELAPCFLMVPQFGRYDDIFASLIAQRVMRELNLFTHFGQPFVWQHRNAHNLLADLKAEQWGAEHILAFAGWLNEFDVSGDVLSQVRMIYAAMVDQPWGFDGAVSKLGEAWCDDVFKVL